MVICGLVFYLLAESGSNSKLGDILGVALLFTIGILILGMFVMPFTTYTNLIFSQDFDYGQNRIIKQNILGLTSTILNLEYPQHIGRVVFNKKTNSTYVTFREKDQDKISDNAPILVINSSNHEHLLATENFLNSFVENAHHDINLVKI